MIPISLLTFGHVLLCRATVEVLPGDSSIWISDGAEQSHSPFLFTENNLGVPENELHRSYLFALHIFATARRDSASALHIPGGPPNSMTAAIQDTIYSSAILVFMNPAHQTALNARKRLIERKLIDAGQELKFTAALLSCRQCCKQGELWHHRRWLLQRIYPIQRSVDTTSGPKDFYLTSDDLSVEMNLVARACELYPRNYFGWTHRTICIQSALTPITHPITPDEITEILSKEVFSVTRWIESHISDYSGVHHLRNLARLANDTENALLSDDLQSLFLPIGRIAALIRAFPEHETLWLYLRGFWVEDEVTAAFIASFILPLQSTGMTGEGKGNDCLECPLGARHARRFLEWRTQRLK